MSAPIYLQYAENSVPTVDAIADQEGDTGDAVSLQVTASGGDAALIYSATGLPAGLSIDPSTGLITGTIDPGAASETPYTVTVTVDDDDGIDDAVDTTFDFTVTEPSADLELTKTVSDSTPALGDDITFTLTVDHVSGDDATGVSVQDLLPDGFTYVSDTGGGDYDPGTGIWTIGGITSGGKCDA